MPCLGNCRNVKIGHQSSSRIPSCQEQIIALSLDTEGVYNFEKRPGSGLELKGFNNSNSFVLMLWIKRRGPCQLVVLHYYIITSLTLWLFISNHFSLLAVEPTMAE